MPSPKKPVVEFDPAKLEKLQEPITVSVQRMINGQKEPVVLPTKPEEQVPGKGFLKDDLMQLDHFLATKWAGAGTYDITAVGSNGENMRWKSYFPESKYPLLHNGEPVAPRVPQQTALGQAGSQVVGAGGFLGGMPMPVQQQWPQPSPWNGGQPNWMTQAVPPWQSARATPWGAPAADDRVQQEREARLSLEARMERERDENRHKESLNALRGQMAELQREVTAPKGDSEEVKLLRDQIGRLEAKQSDDKFMRMIEENRRQTDQMIGALQQQNREQISRLEQLITARPQGPDPTMLLMVETMKGQTTAQTEAARAQADAQKEVARLQAEVQREQARNAIGPREMIELMRNSNMGQEHLASGFAKVNELMLQSVETIIAAQGPAPSPALDLVGQAAQGGLEVAQRYIAMKERGAQAAAQAQVATAQVQAQAAQAQPVRTGPGTTIETPALGEGQEEESEEVADTEEELFGMALPHVQELRRVVAAGAITPEQAATVIIGGVGELANADADVAILDLWAAGQLAELVECVLPEAMTSFQEQMITSLFAQREALMKQAQAAQAQAAKEASQ
jgi:hypothetical protein